MPIALRVQPLAYMAVHMTGVVMTFLLARVFWESFRAHTFFLLFILCISVWNGAGAPIRPSVPSVPLTSSNMHRAPSGRHVVVNIQKCFCLKPPACAVQDFTSMSLRRGT